MCVHIKSHQLYRYMWVHIWLTRTRCSICHICWHGDIHTSLTYRNTMQCMPYCWHGYIHISLIYTICHWRTLDHLVYIHGDMAPPIRHNTFVDFICLFGRRNRVTLWMPIGRKQDLCCWYDYLLTNVTNCICLILFKIRLSHNFPNAMIHSNSITFGILVIYVELLVGSSSLH